MTKQNSSEKYADDLKFKLTVITEANHLLNQSFDIKEITGFAIEFIISVLQMEVCTIILKKRGYSDSAFFTGIFDYKNKRIKKYNEPFTDSIYPILYEKPKMVVLDDIKDNQDFFSDLETMYGIKIKSIYCIPLIMNDETFGVLEIMNSLKEPELSEVDLDLLSLLADQISAVLAKAIQYRETKQMTNEIQVLYELSRAISSTLDMQSLLTFIMDMTTRTLNCEVGIIVLFPSSEMPTKIAWGLDQGVLESIYHKSGQRLTEYAISKGAPFVINNFAENSDFIIKSKEPLKVRISSLIVAPIMSKTACIGIFALSNKQIIGKFTNFNASDIALFTAIVNQISISIDNTIYYLKNIKLKKFNDYVLNSLQNGVISVSPSGIITMKNKSAEKILKKEIIVNKSKFKEIMDFIPDQDYKKYFSDKFVSHNIEYTREINSGYQVLQVSNSIISDIENTELGMVFVIDDITEQKILEKQIERADRLSALGKLSAGIAHEIKNPLTSINGLTQLLPDKYRDKEFVDHYVEIMTKEVSRLNSTVEKLLSFAKPSIAITKKILLSDIVEKTLNLLHYEFKKNKIKLIKDLSEDSVIIGDEQQLEQVILNIIINAIHAMQNIEKKQLTINLYQTDMKVKLEIFDNGIGIPKENMDKLFNPFFTTKETGTGLGLSISFRIVEEHNGRLLVRSRPMVDGTVFILEFPAV